MLDNLRQHARICHRNVLFERSVSLFVVVLEDSHLTCSLKTDAVGIHHRVVQEDESLIINIEIHLVVGLQLLDNLTDNDVEADKSSPRTFLPIIELLVPLFKELSSLQCNAVSSITDVVRLLLLILYCIFEVFLSLSDEIVVSVLRFHHSPLRESLIEILTQVDASELKFFLSVLLLLFACGLCVLFLGFLICHFILNV